MAVQTDPHLSLVRPVTPRTPEGCEECLILGSSWVHLRLCLTCGHVGCCDSSRSGTLAPMPCDRAPHRAVVEPGENWRWSYVDETYV